MNLEKDNFCTLYIVRHGETEMNKGGLLQGQTDSPLTELGVEQVKAAAQTLKDISFDAIFASDLGRAVKTAEIIRLERQIAIQTKELLRERSYGSYEGRPSTEYREDFRQKIEELKLLNDKERMDYKLAADIESDAELVARYITQLREISVAYPGKTVLIASHGAAIRTFLVHVGFAKYSELKTYAVANGGYAKVLCDGIDFFVKDVYGIPIAKS